MQTLRFLYNGLTHFLSERRTILADRNSFSYSQSNSILKLYANRREIAFKMAFLDIFEISNVYFFPYYDGILSKHPQRGRCGGFRDQSSEPLTSSPLGVCPLSAISKSLINLHFGGSHILIPLLDPPRPVTVIYDWILPAGNGLKRPCVLLHINTSRD
ncbi:hypothetical protein JTE90_022526 [Oedothorax gibbosus]|uniref:Uncharacterized protein n=1 Tax=Oedothorax gibbosus TaxID=931172 RepID=A0AAV6V1N0_9ARAC|nr:hypothetical protein JTE90_022526 [Oedothorax gibbosus]